MGELNHFVIHFLWNHNNSYYVKALQLSYPPVNCHNENHISVQMLHPKWKSGIKSGLNYMANQNDQLTVLALNLNLSRHLSFRGKIA